MSKLKASYGKVHKVHKPGARGSEVQLREFLVRNKYLLSMSSAGVCVPAAMREVKGEDVPNEVARRMGDGAGISFESFANYYHRWGALIGLSKVSMGGIDTMEWMGDRNEGMYLVKLHQNQIVYHFVVVSGNRRVVLDIVERFPLKKSVEVLRICGADAATHLVFGVVREVVDQKEFNFSKKRKYRN